MTSKRIDRMPLSKQFALVAHLYKLEIIGLARLAGRTFTEVAMAAGSMVYDVVYYIDHRHAPRHR